VDAPGGGGKRCAHSYEYYNKATGISVYTAPSVKSGKKFMYFDPIHSLDQSMQRRWWDEEERKKMIDQALTLS
jgi:lysine 2,3-aminomutase